MELWQKDLILKNRMRLIETTICSTIFLNIFLSKEILSAEDLQKIGAEERNGGQYQAAAKFYDLIVTRANSFYALKDALQETNQSGALYIFQDRFEVHVPCSSTTQNPTLAQSNPDASNNVLLQETLSKFKGVPAYLTQFLTDKVKTLLVVLSMDCEITCQRLLETHDNCIVFHELESFLKYLVNLTVSTSQLPVLNCKQNLEGCMPFTQDAIRKIVLVASRTRSDGLEINDNATSKNHWTFVNDNITWHDLNELFRLQLCTKLHQQLRECLSENDISKALEEADYATFVDLLNEKPPTLFKNTVPEPLRNYIPRSLSPREIVGKQIFTKKSEDVFFFNGISQEGLQNLSDRSDIMSSSIVVQQGCQITSRFVVLDRDEDFDKINKHVHNKAVHLLHFNGNDFVWMKTCGNIEIIQQCLLKIQPPISELTFMEDLLSTEKTKRHPICISDTPGMGKSVLLAHIARKLQQKISNGLVGFVYINEFLRGIKDILTLNPTDSSLDEVIISRLTSNLSLSSIGTIYLLRNKYYLKELLLDGFDEIDHQNESLGYKLLTTLRQTFPYARLWVTTRPHKLLKLEKVLQVMGINILPFCENDQIHFLTSFWETSLTTHINHNKLTEFARHCLSSIKYTLDAKEQDIAGIPLQCLMIAEIFEDEATAFLNSDDDLCTTNLAITHMIQLYEKLVDKKFTIYSSRYEPAIRSPRKSGFREFLEKFLTNTLIEILYGPNPELRPLTREELITVHIFKSVCLLFPERKKQITTNLCPQCISDKQIVNFGLMEMKNSSNPSFVHRTVAEYFMAILFMDIINGSYTNSSRNLIFRDTFRVQKTDIHIGQFIFDGFEFQNYVICYFIDALLGRNRPPAKFGDILVANLNDNEKSEIVKACAAGNLQNIFSFFFAQQNTFKQISDQRYMLELLCISVFRGCLVMLNVCKNMNIFKAVKLKDLRNSNYTLLHFAVSGGEYQMVKHLCENENFKSEIIEKCDQFKDLVPLCVASTKTLNDKLLEDRIKIFNYILTINKNLIMRCTSIEKGFFLWDDIHIEFVNVILNTICEDETTTKYFLENIIKLDDERMFLDVICILFPDRRNSDLCRLLTSKLEKLTLLQTIVKYMIPNNDICNFLSTIDFGDLELGILQYSMKPNDNKWLNWILKETRPSFKEQITLLQQLYITLFGVYHYEGFSLFNYTQESQTPTKGNNMLHFLFEHYKVSRTDCMDLLKLVRYLVEIGIDVNEVNENKKTPLHVLAKRPCYFSHPEIVYECLIDFGANINAQDADGNTPMHLLLEGFHHLPMNSLIQFLHMGADINIQNKMNETPITIILKNHRLLSSFKCLLTKGNPDFRKKFDHGNTHLHLIMNGICAPEYKQYDYTFNVLFEHLRSIGCLGLLKVPNDNGQTPLDFERQGREIPYYLIRQISEEGRNENIMDYVGRL